MPVIDAAHRWRETWAQSWLLREGGEWINGTNPVLEFMAASLERLEKISTE